MSETVCQMCFRVIPVEKGHEDLDRCQNCCRALESALNMRGCIRNRFRPGPWADHLEVLSVKLLAAEPETQRPRPQKRKEKPDEVPQVDG